MPPHFITHLPAWAYPTKPSYPLAQETPYHYYASKNTCIAFIVCFSLSTILHAGQAVMHPGTRWMLWTVVLCGVYEIMGWSGRLWSTLDPAAGNAYLMQISTTTIAPAFLVTANFIILSRIIALVGPHYSRLSPSSYWQTFLSAELLALVVQTIGDAKASLARSPADGAQGAKIMLGGISLQLAVLLVSAILGTEFLLRARMDRPLRKANPLCHYDVDRRIEMMILGLGVSTIFLFIRTIYRTIELADGWDGETTAHHTLFSWLDGIIITVGMLTLNLLHPGRLVYNTDRVEPEKNQLPMKLSGLSSEISLATPSMIYRSSGVRAPVSFFFRH